MQSNRTASMQSLEALDAMKKSREQKNALSHSVMTLVNGTLKLKDLNCGISTTEDIDKENISGFFQFQIGLNLTFGAT